MQRSRKIFLGKTAAVLAAIPILIYAYETGPDPGNAGVPGESLCTQAGCHVGTANSSAGSVKVDFPNGLSYAPGVKQHLVVTVSDPTARRWGFQLTARASSNAKTEAGSFTPGADGFTQVLCASTNLLSQGSAPCPSAMPMQYIEHTEVGTQEGQTQSGTFAFDWMPPATNMGNIVVYVAGNAANGDHRNTGDHIYSKTYTLTPSAGGGGVKPVISQQNGVVNGASFQPGISAGSWVTIQGSNFSSSNRIWRGDEIVNGKLPTQLDGVSVSINGKPAAIYFISPTQLNVQAPSDNALGPVSVQVVNNGTMSDSIMAQEQAFSPAFFPWVGKYVVATRPDFSLVAKANLFPGLTTVPAKPGEVIVLWGTGFGATDPAIPAGQTVDKATSLVGTPTIRIGGVAAEYFGGALSPGFAGLYQIAVRVPDSTPNGDIPVVAEMGGIQSPANMFITVQK